MKYSGIKMNDDFLVKYGAVLACMSIVTYAANLLSPPGYIYVKFQFLGVLISARTGY